MAAPRVSTPDELAATLRDRLAPGSRVLLTGPVDPDGDSIGACLALRRGLQAVTGARVDVAGRPGKRYDWLPDAGDMVPDAALSGRYDLVVVLDGDRHRLVPEADAAFRSAGLRGLIDHHRSTEPVGYDLVLLDGTAASTCQLVHGVLLAWGVTLDADLAAMLYTGLVFDTGGFRHGNTTPAVHRLAADLLEFDFDHAAVSLAVLAERDRSGFLLLGDVIDRARFFASGRVSVGSVPQAVMARLGASAEDLEGIVDTLLCTRGVEVSCLLIEKPDGRVKVSLRSRCCVDVADLAHGLHPGGGGHARAAGVTLPGPLDAAWAQVPPALVAAAAQRPQT